MDSGMCIGLAMMLAGAALLFALELASDLTWFLAWRHYQLARKIMTKVRTVHRQAVDQRSADIIARNATKRALRSLRRKGVV